MNCPYCNKEWSDPVYPHHVKRCAPPADGQGDDFVDTSFLDDMKLAELHTFAEDENIEIPEEVTLKADVLAFIKTFDPGEED